MSWPASRSRSRSWPRPRIGRCRRGCLFRDRWELSYARCRQTAEVFTALKIEPERLRLSVLPANGQQNKGTLFSEADVAVRVYLSATLPGGVK